MPSGRVCSCAETNIQSLYRKEDLTSFCSSLCKMQAGIQLVQTAGLVKIEVNCFCQMHAKHMIIKTKLQCFLCRCTSREELV